jgi:hypothetical protein
LFFVAGEEVAEERKLGETGPSVHGIRFGSLEEPSEDAYLAVFWTDIVVHRALADDRLVDVSR